MYGEIDTRRIIRGQEATITFHLDQHEQVEDYEVKAVFFMAGDLQLRTIQACIQPEWSKYFHTFWQHTLLKNEMICVIHYRGQEYDACTWIFDGKELHISSSNWPGAPEIRKVAKLHPVPPPSL